METQPTSVHSPCVEMEESNAQASRKPSQSGGTYLQPFDRGTWDICMDSLEWADYNDTHSMMAQSKRVITVNNKDTTTNYKPQVKILNDGDIKDTMIQQQREEMGRLQNVQETLETDLKHYRTSLEHANAYIQIQSIQITAMESQIDHFQKHLHQIPDNLHNQIKRLSKQLHDARLYELTRARDENDGLNCAHDPMGSTDSRAVEIMYLRELVDKQQLEIRKWKQEAMARGKEMVNLFWRESVEEAVRRERERDAVVFRGMADEIERLRAEMAREGEVAGEEA